MISNLFGEELDIKLSEIAERAKVAEISFSETRSSLIKALRDNLAQLDVSLKLVKDIKLANASNFSREELDLVNRPYSQQGF
jgi:hypothetical protein